MKQKTHLFHVYHGTDAKFTSFFCPAYFTDDLETAAFFASDEGNGKILHCQIRLTNPLVVDLDGQSWGSFFLQDQKLQKMCVKYAANEEKEEIAYFEASGLTIGFLADYAEHIGHDGIVAHNCLEENETISTQYVVFDPQNINIEKLTQVNKCFRTAGK